MYIVQKVAVIITRKTRKQDQQKQRQQNGGPRWSHPAFRPSAFHTDPFLSLLAISSMESF